MLQSDVATAAEGRCSACPHSRTGCAGAVICRFAARGAQRPSLREMPRGARRRLPPDAGRWRFVAVREGLVAASADTGDGRRQILCLTGPDELVCPAMPGGPAHSLEALAPARICEIDLSADAPRLARDPDYWRTLYQLAGEGLSRAASCIVGLGRLDGPSRLAAFLSEMCERMGRAGEGGGRSLSLPMTREDIADHLGLSPETVSRLFTRLRREGLVAFRTPTVMEIPDPAALRRAAGLAPAGA